MKVQNVFIVYLLAIILTLFILSGCGSALVTESATTPTPSAQVPPDDNRAFSLAALNWRATDDGNGFYVPGRVTLSYYDLEYQMLIPLCSQSGCPHSDESCEAWLGDNVEHFAVYAGKWLSISNEKDGTVTFRQIDPQSHHRTSTSLKAENGSLSVGNAFVAHGAVYMTVYEDIPLAGGGTSESISLTRLSLENGDYETLFEFSNRERAQFAGADGESVLLLVSSLNADLMTESEFSAAEPEGEYGEYLFELWENNSTLELRLYTWDMSSYEIVAHGDVWLSSTMFLCRYGDFSLYAVGEKLFVYDLATNESKELMEGEGLINFFALDGNAFAIFKADHLQLCRCPLTGGEVVTMSKSVTDRSIRFSPADESAEFIYGVLAGEDGGESYNAVITKEAFYAENYDEAVSVN